MMLDKIYDYEPPHLCDDQDELDAKYKMYEEQLSNSNYVYDLSKESTTLYTGLRNGLDQSITNVTTPNVTMRVRSDQVITSSYLRGLLSEVYNHHGHALNVEFAVVGGDTTGLRALLEQEWCIARGVLLRSK